MSRLSIRSRLLCTAGAILLSSVPAAHLASVQGHNDVIRNLNNTISSDDAQRREDEVRRGDGGRKRDSTGPTSESVDITGTAPIKEITVTDAVTVNVTRPPSARWDRAVNGWA